MQRTWKAALEACRAVGAAVFPRGAGTSLAGQCANVAVVFDYSRHMNGLASIDAESKIAVVSQGLCWTGCAMPLSCHHLTFAPDPATHSRCTLGGMIGNNSCGVHGLLGGKAVDNVESLDIVLYDGTRLTVGATPRATGALIAGAGAWRDLRGTGGSRSLCRLMRESFPSIPRRVSGYNLDELLPENNFHVARALVGQRRNLRNYVSARLNLTASPPFRVLTVLGFDDPYVAADAVPLALEHRPIGLEGFDFLLVDFMRRKGLALRQLDQLPEGVGFLLVEMGAWYAEEARAKAEASRERLRTWPSPPVAHICTPEEAAACGTCASRRWVRWCLCRASRIVGRVGKTRQFRRHSWGISARISKLMAEYGYRSPLYGHYGQGCVHTRINFDFSSEQGIRKFREFIERAADVVLGFGGSLSGEHGDGQSRAALLPKMFGPELIGAFREFKALWDPDNRMNPGKLFDAVRVYDPIENLRTRPPAWDQSPRRSAPGAGA